MRDLSKELGIPLATLHARKKHVLSDTQVWEEANKSSTVETTPQKPLKTSTIPVKKTSTDTL